MLQKFEQRYPRLDKYFLLLENAIGLGTCGDSVAVVLFHTETMEKMLLV